MVRVTVERKLNKGSDIGHLLLRLRTAAMPHRGYISSETLIDAEDRSVVLVISTWDRLEDWKMWETSVERAKIEVEIEPFLAGKPIIRVYEIMSSEEMEHLEDPYGWMQKKERPNLGG